MENNKTAIHIPVTLALLIVLGSLSPIFPSATLSSSLGAGNPVVTWNELTTELGIQHRVPPPFLARDHALVQVAIYDALLSPAGQHHGEAGQKVLVAGAASEVLEYLFPENISSIMRVEARETQQIQGRTRGEVVSGQSLGHAVGRRVVDYSRSDGADAAFQGRIPTGPCTWDGVNPVGPMVGFQKTFILSSGLEFQPEPPYPCGSPQDQADVQAVVDAHDNLTPEQVAIVHRWADFPPPTIWNEMLNERIQDRNLSMLDAARASVYVNIAMYDAFVSTWYTKYTYWTARPFQRIQNFTSVIPTPNFPSYTSGHSTISAAASMVMGELFPNEREFFVSEAEEAAMSRLLAGIHFPHDNNQGLAVGRKIGDKTVQDMRTEPHPFVHPKGLVKTLITRPLTDEGAPVILGFNGAKDQCRFEFESAGCEGTGVALVVGSNAGSIPSCVSSTKTARLVKDLRLSTVEC